MITNKKLFAIAMMTILSFITILFLQNDVGSMSLETSFILPFYFGIVYSIAAGPMNQSKVRFVFIINNLLYLVSLLLPIFVIELSIPTWSSTAYILGIIVQMFISYTIEKIKEGA